MENKKITGLVYNLRFDKEGHKYYDAVRIGKSAFPTSPIVIDIVEHRPAGIGDKWFYDVSYNDGATKRIFTPNEVFYEPIPTE